MKRSRLAVLALAPVLLLSGCGSLGSSYSFRGIGLLYTHTVHPLSLHRDPVAVVPTGAASGDMKEIQFRYVSILWNDKAIGEIAKKGGIDTIHYADLETRSYVLGIWKRHTVRVYGTASKPPEPTPADAGAGK